MKVREVVVVLGMVDIKENVWSYFISWCCSNLYIIFVMLLVGDIFCIWCCNFFGLVNNCVIDWFIFWLEDVLLFVCIVFLVGVDIFVEFREFILGYIVMVYFFVCIFSF